MLKKNRLLIPCLLLAMVLSTPGQTGPSPGRTGWTRLDSGTSLDLYTISLLDRDHLFVAGSGGIILRSSDGGNTWQNISPAAVSSDLNGIVFFDTLTGLVVGDNGTILRTTDGGTGWSPVTSGVSNHLLSVSFSDSTGICGGLSQTILFSTNRGNSWTITQSGFFGGGFRGAFMLSPQIGFVIGENSIFQPLLGTTTDGGLNWSFQPFYLSNNEGRAYDVSFTDRFRGYAACAVWDGRGAIARTSDGGNNWITTFFSTPLYGVCFPISNASLVGFAVGENGTILKTGDAGTSWHPQVSGTTYPLHRTAFLDLDYGLAVGNGGTILKTGTGGEPPVIIDDPASRSSVGFQLLGNYPNPFNSSTKIQILIPNKEFVTLKVYNILGEEIASLLSASLFSGSHAVVWDASGFPSGVYLYRLQAGDFVETRKMLLIR